MRVALKPHPDTPSEAVAAIEVELSRSGPSALTLRYLLTGSIADLIIPAPGVPERKDGLWQHSCFELFVRPAVGEAYWEFNFAPSGDWAAYRLSGYRTGLNPVAVPTPPAIKTRLASDSLQVDVHLVTDLAADLLWQVGVSAVVEDKAGERHFWALAHPPGEPDFHSPDCFALELAPPPAS